LLPNTRSEIALPLLVGDRVIGALDVQSAKEAAFDQENIITLQGMANQVAIALENARLFQETQNSLEEIRTVQRTYLANTWSAVADKQSHFEYTAPGVLPSTDTPLNTIEIPITLRDQPIGNIRLDCPKPLTSEERNLLEAVATQAAIAMENVRLLEDSQQIAFRERLVAEITGKIWSAANVDVILQTSIKELSRALRADEAIIHLD
jgi:GAF domain-containing protein